MVARARQSAFNPEPIFHKTKLCKFHAKGACTRGKNCIFAHGREELSSAPDFSCTSLCPYSTRRTACPHIGTCKFAHSVEQLRPRVSVRPVPGNSTSDGVAHSSAIDQTGPVRVALQEGIPRSRQTTDDKLKDRQEEPQYSKPAGGKEISGNWSRQSTADTTASAGAELEEFEEDLGLDDSDEESYVEYGLMDSEDEEERRNHHDIEVPEVPLATSDTAPGDLRRRGSKLAPTPALVVKNTFIDGADDGCAPTPLRRAHSSPSLLRLARCVRWCRD